MGEPVLDAVLTERGRGSAGQRAGVEREMRVQEFPPHKHTHPHLAAGLVPSSPLCWNECLRIKEAGRLDQSTGIGIEKITQSWIIVAVGNSKLHCKK